MIRKTRQTGAPTIQYKNSVNKNNKNQDTPTEGRRAREGRSLSPERAGPSASPSRRTVRTSHSCGHAGDGRDDTWLGRDHCSWLYYPLLLGRDGDGHFVVVVVAPRPVRGVLGVALRVFGRVRVWVRLGSGSGFGLGSGLGGRVGVRVRATVRAGAHLRASA